MRSALLVLVAGCAVACGPPPPPPGCCLPNTISRSGTYQSTVPLPDGGTPTQIKVNVAANGNTVVTFINNGREIVQSFTGAAVSP
jgi:hypothetical protein